MVLSALLLAFSAIPAITATRLLDKNLAYSSPFVGFPEVRQLLFDIMVEFHSCITLSCRSTVLPGYPRDSSPAYSACETADDERGGLRG